MRRKRYFNNSASQPRLAALDSPFQRKGQVGSGGGMDGAQRCCIRDADAK